MMKATKIVYFVNGDKVTKVPSNGKRLLVRQAKSIYVKDKDSENGNQFQQEE